MNSCTKAHQNRSQIGLVGGYALSVLVWNNSAVGTSTTVALVTPLNRLSPFLGLVEPEAPRVEANVPANRARTPYHHTGDHTGGLRYEWVHRF